MENKKLLRRIKMISVFATMFVVILVGIIVFQYAKLNQLERTSASLDGELTSLQQKRDNLKEGISNRSSDTFVEDYARDYLGMLEDGEVVFIIK